jgi:hypothetical protein
MNALVFLIEQLATGLYILIGVGVFVQVRHLVRARQELRASSFELVRDVERYRQANAITLLVILLQLGLLVFGVQTVVAPSIRAAENMQPEIEQMIVDGAFDTPTPAPPSESGRIDASGVNLFPTNPADAVFFTPVPTATPVGTIAPNPPPVIGCDNPAAQLQVPANGMIVFSPVSVIGVADVPDFAFYKLEISGPSTNDEYAVVLTNTRPVAEVGGLGQLIPATYERGEYLFRLIVFDTTQTARAVCMVNITISDPPQSPTPTPDIG